MKLVNSTNNEVLLKGKQNFIIATRNIQTLEKPLFDALVILVWWSYAFKSTSCLQEIANLMK